MKTNTAKIVLPEGLKLLTVMFGPANEETRLMVAGHFKAPRQSDRLPNVEDAIRDVIKAVTRLEDAHHSRDENSARLALTKAARQLRIAAAAEKYAHKSEG